MQVKCMSHKEIFREEKKTTKISVCIVSVRNCYLCNSLYRCNYW